MTKSPSNYNEMKITDETYMAEEREMRKMFKQVGWDDLSSDVNHDRIQRITERANFEGVSKESVSFIFKSFSTVLPSFLAAAFGSVDTADKNNYRA